MDDQCIKDSTTVEKDQCIKYECNNGNLVPTYVGKYPRGKVEHKKDACVKGGSNVERDQYIGYKYS